METIIMGYIGYRMWGIWGSYYNISCSGFRARNKLRAFALSTSELVSTCCTGAWTLVGGTKNGKPETLNPTQGL